MVYIRKGMVRKVVAAVVLSLGLTSCGSAAVSEEKGHLEEKGATAGKNIGDGNAMAVVSETPEVNEEASESSKEKEVTTDSCFTERPVNDIPVFGVEEKDKFNCKRIIDHGSHGDYDHYLNTEYARTPL